MLVAAVIGTERQWQRTEKQIASNKSFTPASSEVELREAQLAVAKNSLNLFAWLRLGDAEDAFTYALLRQRFLAHRRVPSAEVLPRDFNFAGYLRRLIAHTVTEIL